jgi:spermidine synthase
MTAAFLTGLGMGSALGTRIARRSPDPIAWLAAMLVATGAAATAAAWVAATRLPLAIAALVAGPVVSFGQVVTTEAAIIAVLLLPAALALGAAFPLALAAAAGGTATTSSEAARVYVANTLGAIGGALAAGFVLIPALGLRSTFQAAGVFGTIGAGCLAAAMLGRGTGSRRPSSRGAGALLATSLVAAISIGLLPRCRRCCRRHRCAAPE